MKHQTSNSACDRPAETREPIAPFGPVAFKSLEGDFQSSHGIATINRTAATHYAREMLNLASLVFAFMECKAGGDQEILSFLRLGERALIRVGELLSS